MPRIVGGESARWCVRLFGQYSSDVLILGIIVFGMAAGAVAQMLLGRSGRRLDWGMALIAGLAGSFIGGLLVSLIAGDGLALRASGLIGSIIGAVVVSATWLRLDAGKAAEARHARRR
jgi:uncharacterized membrane protein YeaQ/YmgE (transglycosylase-associated protein family)